MQLIQRKPENRLGTYNPEAVKNHSWFTDFSWKDVIEKKYYPPYIPKKFTGFEGTL